MWPWGDQLERKELECLKFLLYKNKSGLFYCTVPAFCFPLGFLSFHGLTSFSDFSTLFFFWFSSFIFYLLPEEFCSDMTDMCNFLQCSTELGQPFFSYVCLFAFNTLEPKQLCLIWQLLSEVGWVENNSEKPFQTLTFEELMLLSSVSARQALRVLQVECKKSDGWHLYTYKITAAKIKINKGNVPPFW